MHLVRTEFAVRPGSAGEFEAIVGKLGESRKGQPGYLGQTLLHSYAYPQKYVATSRWQNVEAVWAFGKSEAFASFAKANAGGVLSVVQQEGYESVFEVDAEGGEPAGSACEVLVDWTLDQRPGVIGEFERSRREVFEIRRKHTKGFSSNRLRRSAGIPNKYLILNIYMTIEDARAAASTPEVQAFAAAHPYTAYASTPPSIEAYYVVHRIQAS
jgi:heme-degrading monooxygenase HmoA